MHYSDNCLVHCTDNGKNADAEILHFKLHDMMTCSLDRSIKMVMKWDDKAKLYIGNMAGLEFTSSGPKELGISKYER